MWISPTVTLNDDINLKNKARNIKYKERCIQNHLNIISTWYSWRVPFPTPDHQGMDNKNPCRNLPKYFQFKLASCWSSHWSSQISYHHDDIRKRVYSIYHSIIVDYLYLILCPVDAVWMSANCNVWDIYPEQQGVAGWSVESRGVDGRDGGERELWSGPASDSDWALAGSGWLASVVPGIPSLLSNSDPGLAGGNIQTTHTA